MKKGKLGRDQLVGVIEKIEVAISKFPEAGQTSCLKHVRDKSSVIMLLYSK